MIDICDFAVGLSRQLYGLTIASERPGHRMMEQWHPLGAGRRDHRVQLPGRGLGLERDARAGLRRPGDLEAVREDAAHRARRRSALLDARREHASATRPDGLHRVLSAAATSARRSPTTRACRWSRRPGRPRWAAPSAQSVAARLGRACSNSAATTR